MKRGINVYSETSILNKVVLYRPNNEFNNLIPSDLSESVFKDIPDLIKMQKEHDSFANILRKEGIDVVYFIDLVVECLNVNSNIKDKFIRQFIKESGIKLKVIYNEVYRLLSSISDTKKLVNKCIEGIRYSEINVPSSQFFKINTISDLVIEPLTNMCFLRDMFMFFCDGIIISSNNECIRETIFIEYIIKYHPRYKNIKVYNNRYSNLSINTSDILLLNEEVMCISLSKDTDSLSISNLAGKLLSNKKYKHIIVIDYKKESLKQLHLDSLISIIDNNKFVVHNDLINNSTIYELTLHNEKLVINNLHMSLVNVLEKYLHLSEIDIFKCGNGNYFDYEKEQYHHGVNMLCIKPKVVLSYEINRVTNELLRTSGIKVIEVNSTELLKGKDGIHSLSVSMIREK